MNINFDDIKKEEFANFKGGEGALLAHMYFDGNNRILHGTLNPGSTIGYHKHELCIIVQKITHIALVMMAVKT